MEKIYIMIEVFLLETLFTRKKILSLGTKIRRVEVYIRLGNLWFWKFLEIDS